jgi:aldehyde:ferredoxin oxidoreductase
MHGFFNKVLQIDMSNRSYKYEALSDKVLQSTLGGKGLGTYLLASENPPGVEPFSPDNRLIFTVGPLTGTKVWSQSRFAAFSKSPATGGYGEAYCGGSLAPKIKGCGIDAVIIHGKADSLCFLIITPDGVEFHDAASKQGSDTYAAEDYLLSVSAQGAGAMVIGPAGENLAVQACIKSGRWRSLGRGGLGAVMGSKRIKGISFSGDQVPEMADPEGLKDLIKRIAQTAKVSPATPRYQTFGTPAQVAVTNGANCFPTRYWSSGHFEEFPSLSADYMQKNFEVKNQGCPTCFLQCTKLSKVKNGRHAGLEIEGPEYETIYAIGGLNCIDSLEEVAWLNDVCDRLGLDTMSAGNLSGLAIEAYRRGKIDFEIDYNQPDRIAEFYRLLAHAEGVGALFAKGIKTVEKELGLGDVAVHTKGLEPAGFDPRVLKGMGLSYATAARGACHLRGTFYKAELSGEIAPAQTLGKAELHIDYEDRAAIFDCMILCRFFRDFILWEDLVDLVRCSTGLDLDRNQLAALANEITLAGRKYNLQEGIGPEEDTLSKRFFNEATTEGACISRGEIETMVAEYNRIREERQIG